MDRAVRGLQTPSCRSGTHFAPFASQAQRSLPDRLHPRQISRNSQDTLRCCRLGMTQVTSAWTLKLKLRNGVCRYQSVIPARFQVIVRRIRFLGWLCQLSFGISGYIYHSITARFAQARTRVLSPIPSTTVSSTQWSTRSLSSQSCSS
jgi:hypothetical protein